MRLCRRKKYAIAWRCLDVYFVCVNIHGGGKICKVTDNLIFDLICCWLHDALTYNWSKLEAYHK